jgi:transketolase C-terminal domain/subunit
LTTLLSTYSGVVTVEEQLLEGGMGSAVAEAMIDTGTIVKMKRLGIRDGFEVVNGNRDELHALYGIDTQNMVDAALALKDG